MGRLVLVLSLPLRLRVSVDILSMYYVCLPTDALTPPSLLDYF